jgi:RES domain-containing protein
MPGFYRLAKTRYADQAFDGAGARRGGGRWNSKGVAVVYAADSIALAALELLIHLHSHEILNSYRLFRIDIGEADLLTLDERDLPNDWRSDPPPSSTARLGDGWVASNESLGLKVPSVVIPSQRNLLINLAHPRFGPALKAVDEQPFVFDPRLLKGR